MVWPGHKMNQHHTQRFISYLTENTVCFYYKDKSVGVKENFYVLLTVHSSIILVINQLDAQNLVL